eukprot:TRINITY_DN26243_c0_g1_i1.p1 TRINITY_DN26243_c0_g1~~TRINITY_DN26243_c0_g1_i1.p1  ORF type:complete len:298 (+),score=42.26 TRINITY_DN26243_c0_g1_i1:428-1321(+)
MDSPMCLGDRIVGTDFVQAFSHSNTLPQGAQGLLDLHNVRMQGKGPDTIVLGHGFGTDQSVWQHVIPQLMGEYRVVTYDLMGAGSTCASHFSFARYASLHGYADDLLGILEELDVEECIYVGHSVSGMIGLIASCEQPEVFKKIITVGASPRYLNDVGYVGGFEQEELNQLFSAMASNFQAWVLGFAPLAVGADLESRAVREFSRTFFTVRPDIAISVSKTIFQSDLRHILPNVTVACHMLQSSHDLAVPLEVAHYMLEHIAGKCCVEILGVEGHLPQLSSPEVFVPVLKRHLKLDL